MTYIQIQANDPVGAPAYWKMIIQINFYLAIESVRIKKGWTKKQLANNLAVASEDIEKIPTGGYDPTIEKMVDICLALGLVPELYFTENQQKQYDL